MYVTQSQNIATLTERMRAFESRLDDFKALSDTTAKLTVAATNATHDLAEQQKTLAETTSKLSDSVHQLNSLNSMPAALQDVKEMLRAQG